MRFASETSAESANMAAAAPATTQPSSMAAETADALTPEPLFLSSTPLPRQGSDAGARQGPDACGIRVANIFASGLLLQRGKPARVWGYAGTACSVDAALVRRDGSYTRAALTHEAGGRWVATFPPMAASAEPAELVFRTSSGSSLTLTGVLVGDVYLCTGQSNMGSSYNPREERWSDLEIVLGADPSLASPPGERLALRLFAVGAHDGWAEAALEELATPPPLAWADANDAKSAARFSAVCYLFGRDLVRATGVPVGLIESAWGGTGLGVWASPTTFAACEAEPHVLPVEWQPQTPSCLYFSMIAPFQQLGGLSLAGVLMYIGETNAAMAQRAFYECAFKGVVADFRRDFGHDEDLWVSTVVLEPWVAFMREQNLVADFRGMQLRAAAASRVDAVLATDLGEPDAPPGLGSIHPRIKAPIASRLSSAALASTIHSQPARPHFAGPTYERAVAVAGRLAATVHFSAASTSGALVWRPYDAASSSTRCPTDKSVPLATCEWFALRVGGTWRNATVTLVDATSIELSVERDPADATSAVVEATRHGWSMWPVHNLYSAAGLPAVPWLEELTT